MTTTLYNGRLRISRVPCTRGKHCTVGCCETAKPAIPYKTPDFRAEVRRALKRSDPWKLPRKCRSIERDEPDVARADALYGWSKPVTPFKRMTSAQLRAELTRQLKRLRG